MRMRTVGARRNESHSRPPTEHGRLARRGPRSEAGFNPVVMTDLVGHGHSGVCRIADGAAGNLPDLTHRRTTGGRTSSNSKPTYLTPPGKCPPALAWPEPATTWNRTRPSPARRIPATASTARSSTRAASLSGPPRVLITFPAVAWAPLRWRFIQHPTADTRHSPSSAAGITCRGILLFDDPDRNLGA